MHRQFLRYGLVGLLSNGILYAFYLTLTGFGMGHKTAATLLFAVGVTQTFLVNRRWTFAHRGGAPTAYARYWAVYGVGYFLNLSLLGLFVDVLGYDHRIVQGLLIVGIASLLFFAQKIWVFPQPTSTTGGRPQPVSHQ